MRLLIIMLCFIFQINLSGQTGFFNVFDSFEKSNTFVFLKELKNDTYLFGFRQYAEPKTDRLFVVDKMGRIQRWIDFKLNGYEHPFVMDYLDIGNETILIVNAKDSDGNWYIISVRCNSDFEIIELLDEWDLGHIPWGPIVYDSYLFNRPLGYMRISFSSGNNVYQNEIIKIDQKGEFKLIKKIDGITNSDILSYRKIPNSNKYIALTFFTSYVLDQEFNILSENSIFYQYSNTFSNIYPKYFDFGLDSNFTVYGQVYGTNEHLRTGFYTGTLSDSSLIAKSEFIPFISNQTLWNPQCVSSQKTGNKYIGFLNGLHKDSSILLLKTNSIVVQKISNKWETIWTFEEAKKDALYYDFNMRLLKNNAIMVWGKVLNYYGNELLNGFYLKLSPKGEIITKTTFPLPTQTEISVFPNPAADHIILSSDYKKKADFILYNSLGHKVFSKETMMDNTRIDLPNNLVKGAYLYQILDRTGGLLSSGKLVLE